MTSEPTAEAVCACGELENHHAYTVVGPEGIPTLGLSDGTHWHAFELAEPPVEGALTKGTLVNDSQEQVDAPGTDSAVAPLEEVSALEFARWQTGGVAGDLVPGAVEAWAAAIDKRDRYNRAEGGE